MRVGKHLILVPPYTVPCRLSPPPASSSATERMKAREETRWADYGNIMRRREDHRVRAALELLIGDGAGTGTEAAVEAAAAATGHPRRGRLGHVGDVDGPVGVVDVDVDVEVAVA